MAIYGFYDVPRRAPVFEPFPPPALEEVAGLHWVEVERARMETKGTSHGLQGGIHFSTVPVCI